METVIKFLITVALAAVLLALLPTTPFTAIINAIGNIPHIGEINWIIPVPQIIAITTAWAMTCVSYWLIAWVLRQLDILGA